MSRLRRRYWPYVSVSNNGTDLMKTISCKRISELVDGKSILITGGTGSFGRRFIERILASAAPRRVIVFSRDELKQHEMRHSLAAGAFPPTGFFICPLRGRGLVPRPFPRGDIRVRASGFHHVPADP